MAVYQGQVKGGVVVLPPDVSLPEGSTVEVRAFDADEEADVAAAVKPRTLALGLLSEIKEPRLAAPNEDWTPIEVRGRPLSEMIIKERR